ncbi:VOC family protein [Streptomyces syringium]|uniref:VOC family protein n=1 Tax=Streptomyces syringium TaxID=76729 RepID=UPI0036D1A0DD
MPGASATPAGGRTPRLRAPAASLSAASAPPGPRARHGEQLSFRMDFVFGDVAVAEKTLPEMGATQPDHQPGGTYWTVLLAPSGQPFCIHGTH